MSNIIFKFLSGNAIWACDADSQEAAVATICLSGSCQVTDQTELYSLTDCMFILLPPSPALSVTADGFAVIVSIPIDFAISSRMGKLSELPPLEAAILIDVLVDNRRSEAHQQCAINLLCHQIADDSHRAMSQQNEIPLVDDITSYLANHLDSLVTLDNLVKEFSYSKSHICKQFQDKVGVSPMLVLARLRIVRAKKLLEETEMTISQVGHSIGYSTVSSFSHFFKRHTDLSPREYRENIRWLV